jgi:hypothetical protein
MQGLLDRSAVRGGSVALSGWLLRLQCSSTRQCRDIRLRLFARRASAKVKSFGKSLSPRRPGSHA